MKPDCWLSITNESAQGRQYETLNDRYQVLESGQFETRENNNFSVFQDLVNSVEFGEAVRHVRVEIESGAGFDETFTLELDDLSTCESAMYGTMTDELGRIRVTIAGGNLTLID